MQTGVLRRQSTVIESGLARRHCQTRFSLATLISQHPGFGVDTLIHLFDWGNVDF